MTGIHAPSRYFAIILAVGLPPLTIGTGIPVASPAENTAIDNLVVLMNKAQISQRSGHLGDAARLYVEVLRIRPRWGPAEYNLGLVRLAEKNYDEAIGLMTRALQDDPSLNAANLFRGVAYFNTRRFDKALPSLQRFVKLQPNDRQGHFLLARTYDSLGDHRGALHEYFEQIKVSPDREDVYYYVGECYLALAREALNRLSTPQGKYFLWLISAQEKAQAKENSLSEMDIRAALRMNQTVPEAYIILGYLFLQSGRPGEARFQFAQALHRRVADCRALEGLGDAELAIGNVTPSLTEYQKVEEIWPACLEEPLPENLGLSESDYRSRLGSLLEYAKSPQWSVVAIFQLDRLRRRSPRSVVNDSASGSQNPQKQASELPPGKSCYNSIAVRLGKAQGDDNLYLANCLELNDDLPAASAALASATAQTRSDDLRAAYEVFRMYRRLAQRVFAKLALLSPQSYLLAELRAEALELGRSDAAAELEYEKAVSLDRGDPNPLIQYGRFKCKLNKCDEAITPLKKALALDALNPDANALLGEVYFVRNEFGLAIPYLRNAIKSDPHNEQSRIYLADSLARVGRLDAAIAILETASTDTDGRIHYTLGVLYRRQGRKQEMENAFAVFKSRQEAVKSSSSAIGTK